jgi:site-specific DNA recombinase
MFKNTFYYGEYFYDGEMRKGSHEPIITQEEYDQAQRILGKAGKPRPKYKRLPFNGVISCGECGCMITSEEKFKFIVSEGVRRSYIYHHCTKRKLDTHCGQPSIKHEELAKQIKEYLSSLTIPPEFLKWAIEVLRDNDEIEESNREVILKNLRTSQESCVKRVDNLIDLYTSTENAKREMLSEDEFKSRKKALTEEKAKIEAEITKVGQGVSEYADLTEKTFKFATHAKVWFEKGDYEQKTQILQAIGKNFTLLDGKLHIDLQEPFLVIKNASEGGIFKTGRLELKRFSLPAQKSVALLEKYKQKTPHNRRCFLWSG